MNKSVTVLLLVLLVVVAVLSCKQSPSMLIINYNRTPSDMTNPDYQGGNEFDDQLITATREVIDQNKNYAYRQYKFLIRGKRPMSYSFKKYKTSHPDDLIIEYYNGKKLAVYTNTPPTPDMSDWEITWDPNPPKIPVR